MEPFFQTQSSTTGNDYSPRWVRFGSLTILIAAIALFALSLGLESRHSQFGSELMPMLLSFLAFALFLAAYSLRHVLREHQSADRAFHDTHCEFSSIFQNVLDGILIMDNEGRCLDGNPAAASILRVSRNELLGKNIRSLFLKC